MTPARFARLALAAAALLGALPSSAGAADNAGHRRTVVLRLDLTGKISEVARDQLSARLFEGLAETGFQVFAAGNVIAKLYAESPDLAKCDAPACFARLAAALGANFLVTGAVSVAERTYDVSLRLMDGRTGEAIAASKQRCELCGIREANETVAVAAGGLRGGLDRALAPAPITVETKPRGALVVVDGKTMGFAPVTIPLDAGVHAITVSANGFVNNTRTVEVQPGRGETMRFELEGNPGPLRGSGMTIAGWLATGLGIAAIATGAILLAKHGKQIPCTDSQREPMTGLCPREYSTALLGGSLIGAGGGAIGIGGVLLYLNLGDPF